MSAELWLEAKAIADGLPDKVRACAESGDALAQNERDYRVALADKMLRLRAEGMPATIVGDVARGDPEIAGLKLSRDCSEAVYRAACEAVNVDKKRVGLLSEQITREWNSGGADV